MWRASFSSLMSTAHGLEVLLSSDERMRTRQFYSALDGSRFMSGRALLRHLLGIYCKVKSDQIVFEYGNHGKPFVRPSDNPADIRFNLSHSGNWLVCAFTRGCSVGIDIEHIRENIDYEGIAAHIFSDRDRDVFDNLRPQKKIRALFNAWSHKEAYVKAVGGGLSLPLSTIEIPLRGGHRPPIGWMSVGAGHDAARWRTCGLNGVAGYAAALVAEISISRITCFNWAEVGEAAWRPTTADTCSSA